MGAARAKFDGKVKELVIKGGADVNERDEKGTTALSAAAQNGSLPTVNFLLTSGADHNLASEDGRTPLMHAAAAGHTEVVRSLVIAGASPKPVEVGTGNTALHLAAAHGSYDVARVLIDAYPAHMSVRNAEFMTPMMYAQANGKREIVKLIESKNPTSLESASAPTQRRRSSATRSTGLPGQQQQPGHYDVDFDDGASDYAYDDDDLGGGGDDDYDPRGRKPPRRNIRSAETESKMAAWIAAEKLLASNASGGLAVPEGDDDIRLSRTAPLRAMSSNDALPHPMTAANSPHLTVASASGAMRRSSLAPDSVLTAASPLRPRSGSSTHNLKELPSVRRTTSDRSIGGADGSSDTRPLQSRIVDETKTALYSPKYLARLRGKGQAAEGQYGGGGAGGVGGGGGGGGGGRLSAGAGGHGASGSAATLPTGPGLYADYTHLIRQAYVAKHGSSTAETLAVIERSLGLETSPLSRSAFGMGSGSGLMSAGSGSGTHYLYEPPREANTPESFFAMQTTHPRRAHVLHAHEAESATELTIHPGDPLIVTDTSNPDWFFGSLGEASGYFPASHVTILSASRTPSVSSLAAADPDLGITDAISLGDLSSLAHAIARTPVAQLNSPDAMGVTPLQLAVYRGDRRALEMLVRAGADPNSWGPY